jgi:hypothetical protein
MAVLIVGLQQGMQHQAKESTHHLRQDKCRDI